jgi:hypothetical protein
VKRASLNIGLTLASAGLQWGQKGGLAMEREPHVNGRQKIACGMMLALLLFGLMPMESVAMLAPADESIISAGIGSNRTEDLQTVRKVLEQKIVQQRLQDIGLSQDHINARLDRMSDGQLHAMATQLNSVIPAGGDGTVWTIVGILLIVLLVILLATML